MRFIATTLRVLLGLLVLVIGVWAAFDQSIRKVATEGALAKLQEEAADGLPAVSAESVTDRYDGQAVFVQGQLASGALSDPLTGLEVDAVWLKRLVELRQWDERSRCRSSGTGSASTRDCDYWYVQVWSWDLIDSDNFRKPLFGENEHVNPKEKPLDEPSFYEESLDLGAWQLDTAYFSAAFERGSVPADALESAELNTDWRAEGEYLYSNEDPDVRLRYDYVTAPTELVSLIAIPEDGRLTLSEELAGAPLLMTGDVDAPAIVEAGAGQVRDIQQHWIFYTFAGLMLLIRPVARLFPRFNDFTFAPFGKRLAMTAGIAAAITAVIGLLLPR